MDLRRIGWTVWDPIGLVNDRAHCEDEYDSYLLTAAGKIANGASHEDVAHYLTRIECDHMGMSASPGAADRAMQVVREISQLVSGG